jgi:glycosyltransferase involved in cell wall biosynthesis
MRVLHVITSFGLGGAQTMLQRLVEATRQAGVDQEAVALTASGPVADAIEALGVRTHALDVRRLPGPRALLRLAELVRRFEPEVVQTWMYHADLLGGLAARAAGAPRVVWGIHNNTLDERTRRTTRWTVALCARLSRWVPDAIVSVSHAGARLHAGLGYDGRRMQVIANGFDVERFRPDPVLRASLRAELGIGGSEPVIGLAARLDPQKDHPTFLRAAALLAGRRPGVRFLLCGAGITADSAELGRAIRAEGLGPRVVLLGPRTDMPRVYNGLDVATLSSKGEAFPLAIGEAMACGVPCVVTDVGDCAEVVGDTGRVVRPSDPAALAQAWDAMLALPPESLRGLGSAARRRVESRYAMPAVARAYLALYHRLLEGGEAREAGPRGQPPPGAAASSGPPL